MKEEGEMTAEGSGADEAGEAAAEENGEESEPAENMEEEQEENEDEVGKAEGESSGETADPETGSGEGATQAAPSEPGEEGGQSEGTETAAPAAEEEKEPADGEEEIAMGRFAVRFGSEGGIVKVIVSTDEGASEDDPSYILEKTDGEKRTAPSCVPSVLWASGAQCSPARRQKPSLASAAAASSEGSPRILKETIGA